MVKKIFISLILISLGQFVLAQELPVKVYTPTKITTSNRNLKEGDELKFMVGQDIYLNSKTYIKKNTIVTGVITSMENNDFECKEASIYAESFRVKNIDGKSLKLKGFIYEKGRNHWMFTQIIPGLDFFIRGGEVQIKPKSIFELQLEVS